MRSSLVHDPICRWKPNIEGATPNAFTLLDLTSDTFLLRLLMEPVSGSHAVDLHILCSLLGPRSVRRDGVAFVSRVDGHTFRIEQGVYNDRLSRGGIQLNDVPERIAEAIQSSRTGHVNSGSIWRRSPFHS